MASRYLPRDPPTCTLDYASRLGSRGRAWHAGIHINGAICHHLVVCLTSRGFDVTLHVDKYDEGAWYEYGLSLLLSYILRHGSHPLAVTSQANIITHLVFPLDGIRWHVLSSFNCSI